MSVTAAASQFASLFEAPVTDGLTQMRKGRKDRRASRSLAIFSQGSFAAFAACASMSVTAAASQFASLFEAPVTDGLTQMRKGRKDRRASRSLAIFSQGSFAAFAACASTS